ncbi:hypothetical protein GQ55_1G329800 [Panicum hallii var. hallii]|uniref:Uncharacterized protein n=1 Tax=Panicum hallii var. hallii TaxID=1504633 RepID=A0A2T7FA29_9POAL|nr:hypothetical protein GQ55_1G329800 [Panicum hallii var. hallii]
MFNLSSTQALKEQLKPSTTTTVLLVVFILTLYVTSCEGRHLRVHGKDCPSKLLPPSPPKGVIDDDDAAKGKMSSSPEVPVGSNMLDASMGDDEAVTEARKEVASSGGVVRNARNVVRVLQQLQHRWHEDDQGIHLDYAQPRTHTPHHNR